MYDGASLEDDSTEFVRKTYVLCMKENFGKCTRRVRNLDGIYMKIHVAYWH